MLGVNKDKLLLASARLFKTTPVNPEDIGVDGLSFVSHFGALTEIASVKRGTLTISFPNEYVRAEVGTPKKLFRIDYISRGFMIEFEGFEWSADIISLLNNNFVQSGYVVTGPQTWDLTHFGPDGLPIEPTGLYMSGRDVAGMAVEWGMYAGLFVPEDSKQPLTGDDYATQMGKAEATPHANFTTLSEDQRSYGYFAQRIS